MSITTGILPITSNPNRAGSPCAGTRLNTGTVLVITPDLGSWAITVATPTTDPAGTGRSLYEREEVDHRALFGRVGVTDQSGRQHETQVLRQRHGVASRSVQRKRRGQLEWVLPRLDWRGTVRVQRRDFKVEAMPKRLRHQRGPAAPDGWRRTPALDAGLIQRLTPLVVA